MDKRQEGSADSVHSLHSQDTELIDEATSSFDVTQNVSTTVSSNSNSLCVNTGSPQDHSLLDFCLSPNETTTTACSTPHDSKLASVAKRRYTSSSDDQLIIKKLKMNQESLDSSDARKDIHTSRSLDSESSREDLSSYLPKRKDLSTGLKHSIVEYAEANSSISPSEKLVSNSSADSEEVIMVKKQRSPDYLRPKASLIKALSDEYKDSDDILVLKQRLQHQIESLAELQHANSRLSVENRNLRAAVKNQRKGGRDKKDHRGKSFTERVTCSVSYVYDHVGEEITSISIKQMSKQDLFFDPKQPRLSLSSGSLADSSGSEANWIPPRGPSLVSISSTSTVSSSSSSVPSNAERMQFNRFLVPPIPDVRKHVTFKYPKTCVCQCYCSHFVDLLSKHINRCVTPETSSSSENIKPDSHSELTSLSSDLAEDMTSQPVQTNQKEEEIMDESSGNISQVFKSRSSIYIPTSSNLPVFAKWPSNSYCYPGIVENATEKTWHTSSHLVVKFCDGTEKKILSENLFPAYLLPSGTEISFEKDDVCETAILTSIERLMNNELVCLGESKEGIGERVNIPFEKIFLSDNCYKGLKKEMSASITPKKTPKFSISTANVQEGKRTRKLVKFENSSPLLSSSAGRKTRSKGKRTRSNAGNSSSEASKEKGKKRSRSFSQKKQELKKTDEGAVTPNVHAEMKKQVSRKLYNETPGCSGQTKSRESLESQDIISSTDTDSSVQREVCIEEVTGYNLDDESIPDVSLRSVKQKKSTLRRLNAAASKDDKEKGPIVEKGIFSGYNFVFTQATKPKKNLVPKIKSKETKDSFSGEGSGTDFEDYYVCTIPFDYLRLREQVTSGGGRVYRSILHVPVEEYKKTILITDDIVETANYLLAVSRGIPVYRYDLIVNCCIEGKTVAELLGREMKMPWGRSLDTGSWVEKKIDETPLKGLTCVIYLSANQSTINFWWHVLTNAGARIIQNQNSLRLLTEFGDQISFIVGDYGTSKDILLKAESSGIPVVSTVWVTQTIIHGKQRLFDSHPEFQIVSKVK